MDDFILNIITSISYILPIVITGTSTYSLSYVVFKRKLKAIREAIDTLDDALEDDKLNREEFREILNKFKVIIYK